LHLLTAQVLLDSTTPVDGQKILQSWQARWPQLPLTVDGDNPEAQVCFRLGAFHLIFDVVNGPVSAETRQAARPFPPNWSDSEKVLNSHKRHITVKFLADCHIVERMTHLTQATLALVEACSGVEAVLWTNSGLLFAPEKFVEITTKLISAGPPLPIWVHFEVLEQPEGTSSGFTRGLAAFDLLELEASNAPEKAPDLRNRLSALADYTIRNGPVIKDGDTIGGDSREKIRVKVGPSSFGATGQVMHLDFSVAKSPEYKMTTYGKLHAAGVFLCTVGFAIGLYTWVPLLEGSIGRHLLFLPLIVIFGFVLLVITDRIFQKKLGMEAFEKVKESTTTANQTAP